MSDQSVGVVGGVRTENNPWSLRDPGSTIFTAVVGKFPRIAGIAVNQL